jgi:hypothetical protein
VVAVSLNPINKKKIPNGFQLGCLELCRASMVISISVWPLVSNEIAGTPLTQKQYEHLTLTQEFSNAPQSLPISSLSVLTNQISKTEKSLNLK